MLFYKRFLNFLLAEWVNNYLPKMCILSNISFYCRGTFSEKVFNKPNISNFFFKLPQMQKM